MEIKLSYYERNKEKIKARQKKRWLGKEGELKEYRKAYYQANKEKLNDVRKKWREENPEKTKQYKDKILERKRAENREAKDAMIVLAAKRKAERELKSKIQKEKKFFIKLRLENQALLKAERTRIRLSLSEEEKEQRRLKLSRAYGAEYSRKKQQELSDFVIARYLKMPVHILKEQYPELLEAKRLTMLINRKLKEGMNHENKNS